MCVTGQTPERDTPFTEVPNLRAVSGVPDVVRLVKRLTEIMEAFMEAPPLLIFVSQPSVRNLSFIVVL